MGLEGLEGELALAELVAVGDAKDGGDERVCEDCMGSESENCI